VKNLSSPHFISSPNAIFAKFSNDCVSRQAHSIYLIEPRPSNKDIYEELEKAWHQSNSENHFPINISSEFFLDPSYLTNKKLVKTSIFILSIFLSFSQTLTRLIYTLNSNSIQTLSNPINLPNLYTNIPYKQYTIYLENTKYNSTILAVINQALRQSWAKGNSYFFEAKDLLIPSINPIPSE